MTLILKKPMFGKYTPLKPSFSVVFVCPFVCLCFFFLLCSSLFYVFVCVVFLCVFSCVCFSVSVFLCCSLFFIVFLCFSEALGGRFKALNGRFSCRGISVSCASTMYEYHRIAGTTGPKLSIPSRDWATTLPDIIDRALPTGRVGNAQAGMSGRLPH